MSRQLAVLAASMALVAAFAPAGATAPSHPAARPSPSASPRPAANPDAAPARGGAQFAVGVWTVHASAVDANFKTGDFHTDAKITMTRQGGDVTADRANGNFKTEMIYLNGNVVMHDQSGDYGGIGGAAPHSSVPSTLTADKAQIDGQAKIYKAMGNVHFVQGDTIVFSDTGTLNSGTNDLFLQGNVRVTQGARKVNADTVLYNTVSGTAHAQGNVTMQFPGELHRGLATPKPLKIPSNPVTKPATPSP